MKEEEKVMNNFIDRLIKDIDKKNSCVVVGLDPRFEYVPESIKKKHLKRFGRTLKAIGSVFLEFNKRIIDAVADHVVAVKPQIAFFEQYGQYGLWALEEIIRYAKNKNLIVILDAKRSDIGTTAQAYSNGYLNKVKFWDNKWIGCFDVDCITTTPYLGQDSIEPFINNVIKYGKGMFVCIKTSNPSSSDLQDLVVNVQDRQMRLYEAVAKMVMKWGRDTEGGKGYLSIGAVVGAIFPETAKKLRKIMASAYFLVPGYGAQGGTAKNIVNCFNSDGYGAIISSSRDIIFAYQREPWKFKYDDDKFEKASTEAVIQMKEEIKGVLKK